MDEDPRDESDPPPEQEAKDKMLSCGNKPNNHTEELAAANPGNIIIMLNESSDGPAGASPEIRSTTKGEELAAASPEPSRINPNECSNGMLAVSPETSNSSNNVGGEGLPATTPETDSKSPNEGSDGVAAVSPETSSNRSNEGSEELGVAVAGTSKPKESTEKLAAASPGTSRPNEGSEELAAVNSSIISIRPNESTKELVVESPRANKKDPGSENKDPSPRSGLQSTDPTSDSDRSGPSKFYRPPLIHAGQQTQNEDPPPEQEAKDKMLSYGNKPNNYTEELAAANPGNIIIMLNENSDGQASASPEIRSTIKDSEELAAASPESSRINPNESSDGIVVVSPETSSSSINVGGEVLPATTPETDSSSPNEGSGGVAAVSPETSSNRSNEGSEELGVAVAGTSKPNESTEELAAAIPGTSRPNEGSEELAAVNSSIISIRPNESTKELVVESPRANKKDPGSENKDPNSRSGLQSTDPTSDSGRSGPSKFYRPPPMRARQQKQNEAGLEIANASVPTVPTFEQFLLQQVKETKRKEPFAKERNYPDTSSLISRTNQSLNRNEHPQRQRQQNTYIRDMSCNILAEISRSESVIILEKINRQKESFKKLIDSPPDDRNRDVFALVFELVTNIWKSSFEESKKLLLLEICNSKFIDNLQLYLMQLPYTESRRDKLFNKHYWTKEKEFWNNFMTFCECLINVSPSTAVRKCGALIEATSKSCLDGLKEKHDFELPEEYTTRMTNIRDRLKKQAQIQKKKDTSATNEPLESFRELSVLPSGSELLERRPFLRPNVVEGAYVDVEHYLDVQFRLLREDCFGPLREGIHQYIEEPKKRKYDHIRVYRNVKFLGPFFTKQQFGSLVLLDQYTEKMFKRMNWKQSKRFLFGSLLLFTKDNCKSFLVGTILQRDEELLSKRIAFKRFMRIPPNIDKKTRAARKFFSYLSQLGVSIIDSTMDSDLYNEDLYTMIECEVYFEPYHHVLKALQDPSFPEHLAMSKYIVDVQKVPENPAYLTRDTIYTLNKKKLRKIRTKRNPVRRPKNSRCEFSSSDEDEWFIWDIRSGEKDEKEIKFTVLQDETWPSETELGLNNTQYEAYKLALTHEFAVIQGPPGTGKTFLGVKVAKTLFENAPYSDDECLMLVICYTNHALDQFLEALLPITDSIVRIGGRSQSQLLEKHNLRNFRRWACYDERAELEYRIRKLKDFYEACISPDILLNYITVVKYAKECEIVQRFYERKYADALKHWLFENQQNVEIIPRLEENVQSNTNEKLHENNDVDNDIYVRDELGIDDEDIEVCYRELYESELVSFSLPEAEKEKNMLVKMYHETLRFQLNIEEHQNQEGATNYDDIARITIKLQDLQHKIFQLHSHINIFKDMMICQSRAPRINLANVKDLSTVPLIERWSYYYKWATIAKGHLKKQAKQREEFVQSAAEAYEEARMIADRSLLRGTRIIGMTTSAAARLRKLLVEVSPPIVIVEEAAEVLEAHIVTSLTKHCKHLILIGDHQQLRPSAAYLRLARHYQLEVSLFERMIRNGVHSRRLGVQHRMRPEIAALVSPHIYPDLQNHRSVEDFPPVRGVAHNLFFFSHNYMEQHEDENSTRTNTLEADFTLRLANYLMQQGYTPNEVTIVAAYSGQMFYMRRQRSLYDHLSDVKITVLDNYQGEESKIILLSLVRNNDNDSIGFLGTENRICVALSRAREGFFILGNIELLKRNSTLWTNIAQTLADNGSLGSSLKLKCENHGQITEITSLEDFVKVPEGGCLLNCKYNMPCGHPCPRMCHAYDIAHASIQCTRDCERKICEIEGHKCPSSCSTKCQPCKRYMDKQLPCGHTRAVPCYMAPDDPAVYCAEEVTVSLPGCGHKATKPCSKKISDVNCVEKCEAGRLSCGHACIRRCHVNDDPDHENYKCEKPCPRAKEGCTANLEGDLGDHQCPLSCGEPCLPCDVQVNKKRSGCKHWKRGACCEDMDSERCREKCARSLPCGHHCKKRCSETCGDCKQKVKKRIPDCNHEIEIECETEPTRKLCKEKCERTMTCGHSCPADCCKPCDPATCMEITEHSSDAPCGHIVQLPCYVYQAKQSGSMLEAELLSACTALCGALLRCGHGCGGSCSGCRQGRLHQPCAARCHQLNICGHRCEEPCSQVCPPCRRRCSVRCPHSACGKSCGAPCTPCTETPCGRACEHSACRRACGAPCSRAPCSLACPLALACGHPCRGLCGEPCPPACRLCDPEGFPTDLLGDPYEDDAKLIQLQDCPHIWDVDTLDTLMKSENETIQIKACPFCREPIINTYRYKDLVNKMLKNDINPIKEKVYGTEQQRSKKRVELYTKVTDLGETRKLPKENIYWNTAYNALRHVVGGKNKDLSVLHLDMYHIYFDILTDVGDYYTKYVAENLTELKTEMQHQVKMICEALVASKQKISQQQQVDIGQEMKRMNSIVQLAKILQLSKNTTNADVLAIAKTAKEAVLTWSVYDEEKAVECLKKLEEAVKISGIASKEERAMIVRAIGLKAGHWYKCPNGHFYCIGECGGAMQLSQCPDCGAAIGGQHHTLTVGNQHAGEMDDSRFAAWSTEANNMANFQLD